MSKVKLIAIALTLIVIGLYLTKDIVYVNNPDFTGMAASLANAGM